MPKPTRHVLVCTNARPAGNPKGSCAEKGAEALLADLKARARERGLDRSVIINKTGCLKHCSRGVTMAVYPENVWYAGVKPEDLGEILERHIECDEPVERLLMPDIPWE